MSIERSKILIIEDNADTRKFLETVLNKEFEVFSTENAVTGIEQAKKIIPDLILLDIMMPVVNGLDACGILKKDVQTKSIPIIFLTAKNTTNDVIAGLETGADDYMAKPFDYKELIARIKVRLREKNALRQEPRTIVHGDLKIVLDNHEVYFGNRWVDLTKTEFDILRILIQKNGEVVPRDTIINEIWKNFENKAKKRTIDVHIRALRKKIPFLSKHIISVYGEGYKYER